MKGKAYLATAVFVMLCLIAVSASDASTLVIKMQDGNVITLDTSKISSMTFQGGVPAGSGNVGMSISGNWTSSETTSMSLQQTGSDIQGTFPMKNGRITGKLNGSTMEGFWVQDSSARRCNYPRDNSFYWGKIVLTFTPQNYTGNWGYCDDEPRSAWNGVRK